MAIFLIVIDRNFENVESILTHLMIINLFPVLAVCLIDYKEPIVRSKKFMNLTKQDFISFGYIATILILIYRAEKVITEEVARELFSDIPFKIGLWIFYIIYTFSNYQKYKKHTEPENGADT